MKARVKATGEIWTFSQIDEITFKSAINGHLYCAEELEFIEASKFSPDYWERLNHQAAISAMQGFLAGRMEDTYLRVAEFSVKQANVLVEKLKEKEEEK